MKAKPNPQPLKSAFWRTWKNTGPFTWILLVPVLALLLLGHGVASNWQDPPDGQPAQMWSPVNYDPNLCDPFFESNEWSYPDWIEEGPEGHFQDISRGNRPVRNPPRLKHTAKCISNSMGSEHEVQFCEAKLLDANMIRLFIHHDSPGFNDDLTVHIRNGMFTTQYRTVYWIRPKPGPGLIWTTTRQELILDKQTYAKGDVIKGRITFECVQEAANPDFVKKHGKCTHTIKVTGVLKTIVE